MVLPKIIGQILPIRVKILSNTNSAAPRHRKRQKALLPVDMRHRKTPLLKFSNLRRKNVDIPYSSFLTFLSEPNTQAHRQSPQAWGRERRCNWTHTALYSSGLRAIPSRWNFVVHFHLHKERCTTPTSKQCKWGCCEINSFRSLAKDGH